LTEVRGHLKSDATGVYNTNAPYGGCGGERIKVATKNTDDFFIMKESHHIPPSN